MRRSPIIYLIMSVFCQVLGFGVALFAAQASSLSWGLIVLFHALAAGLAARVLKLPISWILMNLALWPGALFFQAEQFSSNLFLLLLALGLLIYLPTFWTRVPFYPTSQLMYQAVNQQLPKNQAFHFIDLGCGYAGLLLFLAKIHPQATFEGIEVAPLPALLARIRALICGCSNLKIKWGSFWKINFAKYNYIYAFLAPDPMPQLWQKVSTERQQGVLLVNSFPVPAKAQEEIQVADERNCKLFIYKLNKQ